MKARIDNLGDRDYGIIELTIDDGYHAGTTVLVYLADDDALVIQIDTPEATETHELIRVYMNEAALDDCTNRPSCKSFLHLSTCPEHS